MKIFRSVEGFEGLYEISNEGDLKSLERIDRLGRKVKEKMLKQRTDKDGYHLVNLSNDGVYSTVKIHRLVAIAFIPNPENKLTVNHKDLNKDNNHDWNLEWNTSLENNFHASEHGMNVAWKKGTKHPCCKLTEKDVLRIRELRKLGLCFREIGAIYSINTTTVHDIVKRKSWKHIK